jgi:ABC-2 type transport system permease protein
MSIRSLLKKELHWSKRNVLVLVFLLLILPAFFAGTSLFYQDTLPRNVPIAVVATEDNVTEDDLTIIEGGLAPFAEPRVVESEPKAMRQLNRETVYAVVGVPANITAAGTDAQFTVTVDGSIVPFQDPSKVITRLMEFQLDQLLAADISAERTVIGEEKALSEYLFPTFLMTLIVFFAFTYAPYNLGRERAVLDRLRVETSLEAVVFTKLAFLTTLMFVPILVFHAGSTYVGYAVDSFAPGAVLAYLMTFLLLATVSMTVMFLARFSAVGQFVNVVLMLGTVALSALAFPRGFFSTVRTSAAQLLPPHYSMIIARSQMLKETDLMLFSDWLLGFTGVIVVALLGLELSIIYYRRNA